MKKLVILIICLLSVLCIACSKENIQDASNAGDFVAETPVSTLTPIPTTPTEPIKGVQEQPQAQSNQTLSVSLSDAKSHLLDYLVKTENPEYTVVKAPYVESKSFQGECRYSMEFVNIFASYVTTSQETIAVGTTNCEEGLIARKNKGRFPTDDYLFSMTDVWMAKFDNNLNIMWKKTFLEGISDDSVMDFYITADGNYEVIIKYNIAEDTTNNYEDMVEYYTLQDDEELLDEIYHDPSSISNFIAIKVDNSGSIISEQMLEYYAYNFDDFEFEPQYKKLPYATTSICIAKEYDQFVIVDDLYQSDSIIDTTSVIKTEDGYYFVKETDVPIQSLDDGFHYMTQEYYEQNYRQLYINALNQSLSEYPDSSPNDILVIKTDTELNIEWYKYLGGSGDEKLSRFITGNSGDLYLEAETWSVDGDVNGYNPDSMIYTMFDEYTSPKYDRWIVKLTSDGELAYSKCNSNELFVVRKDVCNVLDNGAILFFIDDKYPVEGHGHGGNNLYFTGYYTK